MILAQLGYRNMNTGEKWVPVECSVSTVNEYNPEKPRQQTHVLKICPITKNHGHIEFVKETIKEIFFGNSESQ